MTSPRLLLGAAALVLAMSTLHAEMPSLYTVPVKSIEEKEATLQPYAGNVLLIVNTASECGFTPQYKGLEALYQKYHAQGLEVLGFPSNDFGQQEPGTNAQIKEFCSAKFHVTFPMFAKIKVLGKEQHPLYAALTGVQSPKPGPVTWNFNKFLIGRDGKMITRFDSEAEPDSPVLAKAIEGALQAK